MLQTFIEKTTNGAAEHRDIKRYWIYGNEGENRADWLRLVNMVDNAHRRKADEASSSFSTSFPLRATKYWNSVSAPYLNDPENTSDGSDGIVDDSEIEDDVKPAPLLEQEDVEGDVVKCLRRKNLC